VKKGKRQTKRKKTQGRRRHGLQGTQGGNKEKKNKKNLGLGGGEKGGFACKRKKKRKIPKAICMTRPSNRKRDKALQTEGEKKT